MDFTVFVNIAFVILKSVCLIDEFGWNSFYNFVWDKKEKNVTDMDVSKKIVMLWVNKYEMWLEVKYIKILNLNFQGWLFIFLQSTFMKKLEK